MISSSRHIGLVRWKNGYGKRWLGLLIGGLVFVAMLTPLVNSLAQAPLILPILRNPTTLPELWNAVFFELEVGNYGRASDWLTRFWDLLQKTAPEEREKFLLDIYDRDGLIPFLRLANHPQMEKVSFKDEKTGQMVPISRAVLQELNTAFQKRLGDEKLLQFYVDRLKGRPGERRYAMTQLMLAGEQAVPYLIQILADPQRKDVHDAVVQVLRHMRGNAVAPLLATMADAPSPSLRIVAFEIALEERDPRMIPYLWLAQANPKETPVLREEARRALASLLHRPLPQRPSEAAESLGDWRRELLREAEEYYHHRKQLPPGDKLRWWSWQMGKGLVAQTVNPRDYEVLASTYWLRKILDITPDYRPAQVLLTSVLLERALELGGWDKPLTETSPQLVHSLTITDPRVLEEALRRALRERKTATAAALLQVLAEIRDARLSQSGEGSVSPLVQALSYPDPRVQWLAAVTLLRTPHPSPFPGSSRVVEILARSIVGSETPRAVLAMADAVQARQLAERFRAMGYEPVVVHSCREVLRELANTHADFLVLDLRLADLPLDHVLSLLRQSPEAGGVPVLLWGPERFEREAQRLASRFALVSVAVPMPLSEAMLQHLVQSATVPKSPPLSPAQRQANRQAAFDWLLRIARGELAAFSIEPALPALTRALNDDNLAPSAAAVLAHVRGRSTQQVLAQALLAAQRPEAVQVALAQAFYEHVQANTYLLGDEYRKSLLALLHKPVPATVRDLIVRLLQQLSASPQNTGRHLLNVLIPAPPAKP